MATTDQTPQPAPTTAGRRLSGRVLLGILALLAPLSYALGRVSAMSLSHTYAQFVSSGLVSTALGVMLGIPLGIFFGTLRQPALTGAQRPPGNTIEMERSILVQLRRELEENLALFTARKGSTTLYARIEYITPFWVSIKASGRLFVMQDAELLSSIGTAYYWLEQATHLETLAYEAKYTRSASDAPGTAERLLAEARILDGQLDASLTAAISAINLALAPR